MTVPRDADKDSASGDQPADDRAFWNRSWKAKAHSISALDSPTWENEREEMLLDFIRPWLPATGTVAEIGCGGGRFLARIARLGSYELVAIDYAEEALHLVERMAREFNLQIRTMLEDANGLNVKDESFDFVLSVDCWNTSSTRSGRSRK